MIQIQSLLQ